MESPVPPERGRRIGKIGLPTMEMILQAQKEKEDYQNNYEADKAKARLAAISTLKNIIYLSIWHPIIELLNSISFIDSCEVVIIRSIDFIIEDRSTIFLPDASKLWKINEYYYPENIDPDVEYLIPQFLPDVVPNFGFKFHRKPSIFSLKSKFEPPYTTVNKALCQIEEEVKLYSTRQVNYTIEFTSAGYHLHCCIKKSIINFRSSLQAK